MKKLVLIPTALIGITAPIISLVGCNRGKTPEPEPEHDYSKDYLTFTAIEDCTFSISNNKAIYVNVPMSLRSFDALLGFGPSGVEMGSGTLPDEYWTDTQWSFTYHNHSSSGEIDDTIDYTIADCQDDHRVALIMFTSFYPTTYFSKVTIGPQP